MVLNAAAKKLVKRLEALDYSKVNFDVEKISALMLEQYKLLNIEAPKEIVVADDILLGFQLATGAARGAARDAAWGAARDAARDAARGAARDAAWGAARDAARDAAWGAARDAAAVNTGLKDPATLKWIEVSMKELEALEAGLGFFFPMKDKLILVPTPRMAIENEVLHSDHGKAVEWSNGTGFYFLHGVQFKEDEWQKIINQELGIEHLEVLGSADKRTIAIKMLQADKLLEHMNARLINIGEKGTMLYEVKNFMDTGDTEYCMKMKHPSLDRHYIEWVEPKIGKKKDADLAQATAFGVSKEYYLLAQEA